MRYNPGKFHTKKGVRNIDKRYRHEVKHAINYCDMLCIRQRISAVARSDPHAPRGQYEIRSLYFDNDDDKALREKIYGSDRREKFRIRYYNNDTSFIRLEKKSRLDGLGTKYSAKLTKEETQNIIDGDISFMKDHEDSLIRELYLKMNYQRLRPKTVVDYTREPYVFDAGNVRVTFDHDIRMGMGGCDMFSEDFVTVPAGDAPVILEVKWDDFLPGIIRDCVQTRGVRATSFSKYAQCRIYG